MKTVEIKSHILHGINGLNSRQLNEVYGLFQNYLNSNDDTEEWDNLSSQQQDKIMAGLEQANANKTKPVGEITARLRKKYGTNG
jgi:hypothetical protein